MKRSGVSTVPAVPGRSRTGPRPEATGVAPAGRRGRSSSQGSAGSAIGRKAHTLLEVLLALSVATVALVALATTRVGPALDLGGALRPGSATAARVRPRLAGLVAELQEATGLLHPPPEPPIDGSDFHDGLAWIDPVGGVHALVYEPPPVAGEAGSLRRLRLDRPAGPDPEPGPETLWLAEVHEFRVDTARPAPGMPPSLVHLEIAVRIGDGGPGPAILTRHRAGAFLRNVEVETPDDLFPPGSPGSF